jgi:A/G-specific adenine glycosylase
MLQQTQVSRVEPVYLRFIASYPTPASFATATPEQVVAAWEGLGYLRRVRHLQTAARRIETAGWPADLTELPGVGPYTAAAIRAFTRGEPVAAIDVNLRRVLSRWKGRVLSVQEAGQVGNDLVDGTRPGPWNQAMMDLGAGICRPRTPRCDECPVAAWCRDPSIGLPSARQPRFEGSVRQARAAVMKLLVDGPRTVDQLGTSSGLDPVTVSQACAALIAEEAIARDGESVRLR